MAKQLCIITAIAFVFGQVFGREFENYMARCIENIATRHVSPGSSLVISYYRDHKEAPCKFEHTLPQKASTWSCENGNSWSPIIYNLFQSERYSVTVNEIQNKKFVKIFKTVNHEAYIILTGHNNHSGIIQDVREQIMVMRRIADWNPRAKFVVAVLGFREESLDGNKRLVDDILTEIFKWQIINAVVVIKSEEYNETMDTEGENPVLDVFTWFPYIPPGRCGDVKNSTLLDRWMVNATREYFLTNQLLFPLKVPKDMHGCPLKVSTFEFGPMMMNQKDNKDGTVSYNEGVEFLLLQNLAKISNMTLIFRPPPPDNGLWGIDLGNGTWNGVPGELVRGDADIGAAGLWYKCDLIGEVECLTPHMIDTIQWYVPCAKPNPRWTSLTRVFKASLWIGFLLVYVIVSIIMWIIVKINNAIRKDKLENQAYDGIVKCLLNFWAIILEESASNYPPDILSIRTVFLTWVLYCWAVNNVYQTFLTSFLVDPGLQHQISSEDEMLSSGIEYGVFPGTAAHVRDLTSSRYPDVQTCYTVKPCLDRVAFKGDFAFVFSTVLTDYQISVYYMDGDGKPIMCLIKDLVCFHLIILPIMKGNPKLEIFNEAVLHLVEGGFVQQWYKLVKYHAVLMLAKTFSIPPGEYIKLSLKHLQSAFYFLLLGYVLSVVSFVSELCRGRSKFRKLTKDQHTKIFKDKPKIK
jgi:Ligand-gated ion channel.